MPKPEQKGRETMECLPKPSHAIYVLVLVYVYLTCQVDKSISMRKICLRYNFLNEYFF